MGVEPLRGEIYLASDFGLAQVSDGVAVIEVDGIAELVVCDTANNRTATETLGSMQDPGSGVFSPEGPGRELASVQASDGIAVQDSGTTSRLFLFGATSSSKALTMSTIGSSGQPGSATTVQSSNGALYDVETFTLLPDQSGSLTAVSQGGAAGFTIYEIEGNGFLQEIDQIGDDDKSYVHRVTDSVSVVAGGQTWLLTISAKENGLTSYGIEEDGTAFLNDSLGNQDGLWISGPTAIESAEVQGESFVIIAASTSDSLSVVRVNDMGCLFVEDHVIDDRDSRFEGASALDVYEIKGRSFIIAGGSDGGLTTFELLPGGELCQMDATPFESGAGMGNIASIDAVADGTDVTFLVTEEAGTRLMVFEADYSSVGSLLTVSGTSGGTLNGANLDDRLMGNAGADTLSGGNGADYLHDGAGADRLTGGSGEDVFVFASDSATDSITDFTQGQDRIDLSSWGRIYDLSVLTITQTSTGAQIRYGGEVLNITSSTGAGIAVSAWDDGDFIF